MLIIKTDDLPLIYRIQFFKGDNEDRQKVLKKLVKY
jgi:hypothetical protein